MIRVDRLEDCKIGAATYEDIPSFSGIVTGECKGDLWVDNIENPSLVMVYSYAVGGFSILGETNNKSIYHQLYNFLTNDFFLKLKENDVNDFEFSAESIKTQAYVLEMFQDKAIESEDEFTYHATTKIDTKMKSLSEYTFVKVDQKFIEQLEQRVYHNQEFLTKRLLLSWGSYTDFLNKSIAYVAVYQNKIVSIIVGTARFHNIIAIDIETEEQHRKKGLAYELTQRFVNECVDHDLIAHWNCVDSNITSKKTAEKSGFLFIKKKPFFWFNI